jgi:hypothetical protein
MLDTAVVSHQDAFAAVYSMITEAQSKAWRQVNNMLIELYWNIGQYVSERVKTNGWGKGIVEEMSKYVQVYCRQKPLGDGFFCQKHMANEAIL